jgi:hypothetical protein
MLGSSHIAWALNQVTKGGGKENFMWGKSQQQVFDDMKNHLCLLVVEPDYVPDLEVLAFNHVYTP